MLSDSSSACSKGSYAPRHSYNSTRNIMDAFNQPFDDGINNNYDDQNNEDNRSLSSVSEKHNHNVYSIKDQEVFQ